MATNTTKLNLVKPELSDYADIRVLNGNMDIIDKAFTNLVYITNVTTTDTEIVFTKNDNTEIKIPFSVIKGV